MFQAPGSIGVKHPIQGSAKERMEERMAVAWRQNPLPTLPAVKGCERPAPCFCAASGLEAEFCSFINPSSAAALSCITSSWVFQSKAGKYSQDWSF